MHAKLKPYSHLDGSARANPALGSFSLCLCVFVVNFSLFEHSLFNVGH